FAGLFFQLFFAEEPSAAMATTPAFALLAAAAWQRTARPLRAIGLVLALVAGFSFVVIVWFRPAIFGTLFDRPPNDAAWLSLRPLFQIGILSLLFGTTARLVLLK